MKLSNKLSDLPKREMCFVHKIITGKQLGTILEHLTQASDEHLSINK